MPLAIGFLDAMIVWRFAHGTNLPQKRLKINFGPETTLALAELLKLDDAAFRKFFAGSPVRRAGHVRFLRNVLVAAGNSGDSALVPMVMMHLHHNNPLVRGMSVWALSKLTTASQFQALTSDYLTDELDETVQAEWVEACATRFSVESK